MKSRRAAGFRRAVALAAALAFSGGLLAAPSPDEPHWRPDETIVAEMESGLRQRMQEAHLASLDAYARNYWGVTLAGSRMVYGQITHPYPGRGERAGLGAGVVVGSEPDGRFAMADGFCNNIHLLYDVAQRAFRVLRCDGWGALTPPESR